MAKLLTQNDVDGSDINRLDADGQAATGTTVARGGDGAARVMADGGTDAVSLLVRTDRLDVVTKGWLLRAYDDGIIDADDIRRIARGFEEGNLGQAAVQRTLVGANNIEANGHTVQRLQMSDGVNAEFPPHWDDPYASNTLAVGFATGSDDQFVRVHHLTIGKEDS